MKKRGMAILMTAAMAAGMLAGCGAGGDNAAAATSASTEAETTAAEAGTTNAEAAETGSGDPVYIDPDAANVTGELNFYTAFAGENGIDDLIADFNTYYPNVKVTANVYKNSPDGNLGLDTAMVNGNVDVLMSFGPSKTYKRWNSGMFMDLTDRLAKDNLDLVKEWGTDTYTADDGKIYVFPSGGLSIYVAINKDKWDEAGLGDIPTEWTYDEYLDACRKMTVKDGSGNVTQYGGSDFNQTDYWTYSVCQSKGKDAYYKEDGSADFDNPLFAKVLQREIDAEAEGIWYSKANYLADSTKSRDMFLNGTTASTIESILTRYIVAGDPQFKIYYAPYPVNEEGETNYMAGTIHNSFVAVSSNTKNPDAAYDFAKFVATYGNKYQYAAGHAGNWTGIQPDDILEVIFGSKEEAEKYIDTESFSRCVIASGEPSYEEKNLTGIDEIGSLVSEYTKYCLNGEMKVEDAMSEVQDLANTAISDAQ